MRLDFANQRVLSVVAHADDAELLCAGTLARAQADGAAVGVAVLCLGDKGQPSQPIPRLATVRRGEMAAAARLLGADLFWGRVPDGTLADDRPARVARADHSGLPGVAHAAASRCRAERGRLRGAAAHHHAPVTT